MNFVVVPWLNKYRSKSKYSRDIFLEIVGNNSLPFCWIKVFSYSNSLIFSAVMSVQT